MNKPETSKKQGIGIEIEYKGTLFNLEFFRSGEVTSLLVEAHEEEGVKFDLVDDLLGQITDTSGINIDDTLTTIILYDAKLTYLKKKANNPALTEYGIAGKLGWKPEIDFGGEKIQLVLEAEADIWKTKVAKGKEKDNGLRGTLVGMVKAPIPGIESLKLGLGYEFGEKKDTAFFNIWIGKYGLRADYDNNVEEEGKTVEFRFVSEDGPPSLTLGEVITFFASLIDPSIDEYEFEPPWDFLSNIDLGDFLEKFKLLLTLKKNKDKIFGIRMEGIGGLIPDFAKSFLTLNAVELTYKSTIGGKKTSIKIDGKFLGKDSITWDPVNESPPEVPGKGPALFELRYLGIGQRVAFKDAARVESIGEVMGLLRGALSDAEEKLIANRSLSVGSPKNSFLGPEGPIVFDAKAAWLIGMDVSLLKMLSLSLIFNDPYITGIRIGLDGKMAKNFAGLKFEILYQRVNETTGKYHTELVLPDIVRHMTVGAVSVTLPIIVVDIFTNGDFKIDLGFPWDFNFERSFGMEVFIILPFTGSGGFYFNKLSAATATSTPALKEKGGEFTPVYEFGLGLKVGLGKSIKNGPLKAEFSITLQAIIEGVFANYNSPPAPVGNSLIAPGHVEKSIYYAVKGGVAIVGRLYGEADFVVISVKVEVIVKVSAILQIESYQPIEVIVSARVTVEASATVFLIEVDFEFDHEIREEFIIPSPDGPLEDAPWHNYLA